MRLSSTDVKATSLFVGGNPEIRIDTEQYTVHVWHLRDGEAEMLEVFATLDEALEAARRR
jgi:hypothetical protein